MERGTFQDSATKLINALWQILETVAISKCAVGKLMPTFVNSFEFF